MRLWKWGNGRKQTRYFLPLLFFYDEKQQRFQFLRFFWSLETVRKQSVIKSKSKISLFNPYSWLNIITITHNADDGEFPLCFTWWFFFSVFAFPFPRRLEGNNQAYLALHQKLNRHSSSSRKSRMLLLGISSASTRSVLFARYNRGCSSAVR